MNIEELPMDRLKEDASFRFSSPNEAKILRLSASIRQSGLRTPLSVHKEEGGYRVVAGFSRLESARAVGLTSVPAEVAVAQEELEALFFAALLEHRCHSDFRLFEKARILAILDRLGIGSPPPSRFLGLLDLPSPKAVLDAVRLLLFLSSPLQTYLERQGASLKQASFFFGLPPAGQEGATRLAEALMIRPVELIEIMALLEEISRRDGVSIEALLEAGIQEVLDSDISRQSKISEIKRWIFEKRFPFLSRIHGRVEATLKRLSLPPHVRIDWDRSVERPGIRLETTLGSEADVRSLIRSLERAARSKAFCNLFTLLGNEVDAPSPDP